MNEKKNHHTLTTMILKLIIIPNYCVSRFYKPIMLTIFISRSTWFLFFKSWCIVLSYYTKNEKKKFSFIDIMNDVCYHILNKNQNSRETKLIINEITSCLQPMLIIKQWPLPNKRCVVELRLLRIFNCYSEKRCVSN